MLIESQFLEFIELPQKKVTRVFEVKNKVDVTVGIIQWFASWRRYVMHINDPVVLDADCLKDVVRALDKLMLERKIEDQNKKTQDG